MNDCIVLSFWVLERKITYCFFAYTLLSLAVSSTLKSMQEMIYAIVIIL